MQYYQPTSSDAWGFDLRVWGSSDRLILYCELLDLEKIHVAYGGPPPYVGKRGVNSSCMQVRRSIEISGHAGHEAHLIAVLGMFSASLEVRVCRLTNFGSQSLELAGSVVTAGCCIDSC